jgi:uncharacterized protein YndB with AHSA1/START domain
VARNQITVDAAPSTVWEVLVDPYAYPRWVVGADRTLQADPRWPEPGAWFKVRLAIGIPDYTHCRELDPGRRIKLDAGGGPLRGAHVEVLIEPEGDGTHVTLIEDPGGLAAPLRFFPPAHLLTRLRNAESLRRFQRICEARRPASVTTAR